MSQFYFVCGLDRGSGSVQFFGDRLDATAGQVVGHIGNTEIVAAVAGQLRGLTRSGVPVVKGIKIVEIDPRNANAVFSGIGERPAKIAEGARRAVQTRLAAKGEVRIRIGSMAQSLCRLVPEMK